MSGKGVMFDDKKINKGNFYKKQKTNCQKRTPIQILT